MLLQTEFLSSKFPITFQNCKQKAHISVFERFGINKILQFLIFGVKRNLLQFIISSQNSSKVMDSSLPPIKQMYNSTRENRDYGVTRTYQSLRHQIPNKKRATKRGHYLEDYVRLRNSPGPANKSNKQPVWATKSASQLKCSQRKTYIDQIQKSSKKHNSPSSSHYKIQLPWPKKEEKVKHVSEKISFVDNCLYEGDKTPGPGNYQISGRLGCKISDGKISTTKPLQPRNINSAEMGTYNPCSIEYNTFDRIALKSKDNNTISNPKLSNSTQKENKLKKNLVPGPGHYQVLSNWGSKADFKKGDKYYWDKLSFGPKPNVYYGSQNA